MVWGGILARLPSEPGFASGCSPGEIVFEEPYESLAKLFTWRWPEVGEISALDVERVRRRGGRGTLRLAVAYRFSIGVDGPYTGASFWKPWYWQIDGLSLPNANSIFVSR